MFSRRFKKRFKWSNFLGVQETREMLQGWWKEGWCGMFVLVVILRLYIHPNEPLPQQQQSVHVHGGSRMLLQFADDNTTNPVSKTRQIVPTVTPKVHHGPEWEGCDYELNNSPYLWLVHHIMWILITFIALALICDDFFVPSLEAISERLGLSEDVAGATFMAAGSSAPELFSSIAGMVQESDVGVGTIVGSAVFNLLIIIALTAGLAGQVLVLDWRPLARDSFFYGMSIMCFVGFAWDGYFTHYESAVLLSLYGLYILLMVYNSSVMNMLSQWIPPKTLADRSNNISNNAKKDAHKQPEIVLPLDQLGEVQREEVGLDLAEEVLLNLVKEVRLDLAKQVLEEMKITTGSGKLIPGGQFHHVRGSMVETLIAGHPLKEEKSEEMGMNLCPCLPCCPLVRAVKPEPPLDRDHSCLHLKLCLRWLLFIPSFPFLCIFSWTIPDCRKYPRLFLVTFLISVVWIAALSFVMVTLVGRSGCIIDIDAYVMGVLVIAVGTSVPDCLSSILVARDGMGDMAVSNAIGSNVFDINLGLGAPFLIRIFLDLGSPIVLLDDQEMVDFETGILPFVPHAKFGLILLVILFIALLIFYTVGFRLGVGVSGSFLAMYIIFMVYTFTQELYCKNTLEMYC